MTNVEPFGFLCGEFQPRPAYPLGGIAYVFGPQDISSFRHVFALICLFRILIRNLTILFSIFR